LLCARLDRWTRHRPADCRRIPTVRGCTARSPRPMFSKGASAFSHGGRSVGIIEWSGGQEKRLRSCDSSVSCKSAVSVCPGRVNDVCAVSPAEGWPIGFLVLGAGVALDRTGVLVMATELNIIIALLGTHASGKPPASSFTTQVQYEGSARNDLFFLKTNAFEQWFDNPLPHALGYQACRPVIGVVKRRTVSGAGGHRRRNCLVKASRLKLLSQSATRDRAARTSRYPGYGL